MFKQPFSENSLLYILFSLVVGLAFPAFHSVMDDSEVRGAEAQHLLAAASRTVASIAPTAKPTEIVKRKPIATTAYDLSCLGQVDIHEMEAEEFIQFKGRNCLAQGLDIEIVNRTNGYTASVFFVGKDIYQTDLIQLQKGENEIAFRYKERNGKSVERTLKVRSSKI